MNLTTKLLKIFYMPLCRMYAKYIIQDKVVDAFYGFLCSLYFFRIHRYWPHLNKPRSFSEKIWHMMLNNRAPLLTIVSDKLRVRDYVKAKVGSNCLIPILWQGDNPEDIPFDDLPKKYVIKANHGCGYNIIVLDASKIDSGGAKKKLKEWLSANYCQQSPVGAEWAYKNIKPTIMIEEFIGNANQVPYDYKFFCYSGHAEFIQVNIDRFGDSSEKILDRDFNPIDVWYGLKQNTGKIELPINYAEMLQLADSLSKGFDFIRVDLYCIGSKIYFGELTCYPAGGIARLIPKEYDFIFGDKWIIK